MRQGAQNSPGGKSRSGSPGRESAPRDDGLRDSGQRDTTRRDGGKRDADKRDVAPRESGLRASKRGATQNGPSHHGPAGALGHSGRGSGRVASARAPSQRQLRVAEEIRHLLAGVFSRADFRHPDLAVAQITVTEVRASPDLKHATVFVTRLGRTDVEPLLPALRLAAPFLRGQLAQLMRLRVAPQLSFQADGSIDYAMHVDELLRAPEVARDLAGRAGAKPPAAEADAAPDPAEPAED